MKKAKVFLPQYQYLAKANHDQMFDPVCAALVWVTCVYDVLSKISHTGFYRAEKETDGQASFI